MFNSDLHPDYLRSYLGHNEILVRFDKNYGYDFCVDDKEILKDMLVQLQKYIDALPECK